VDPLQQFLIKPIIPLKMGGFDLSFTNSSLAMVMATALILWLCNYGSSRQLIIPSRLQSLAELTYEFINTVILETIGPEGRAYLPFILSIFLFVFFGNIVGMAPYSFTFTSHIIVTLALALCVYAVVLFIGLRKFGIGFFKRFIPSGVPWPIIPIIVPVEIISFFFRPLSLAVRLFANMLAGHILLKIFAGFCLMLGIFGVFPVAFNTVFIGFEIFVAGLQAYIFTILSCVYLQDALHSH